MVTSINLTLLVQVFNFLVAYLIVRHLLVSPSIGALEREDAHRAEQRDLVKRYTEDNRVRQEALKKAWLTYEEACASRVPTVAPVEEPMPTRSVELSTTTEPEHKAGGGGATAEEVARLIVRRMGHVR